MSKMISDSAIKQKFIIDNLKDAAESAFRFQLNSFGRYRKSRTGATLKALSSPDFIISAGGSEFILVASVTKQLRMQDLGAVLYYIFHPPLSDKITTGIFYSVFVFFIPAMVFACYQCSFFVGNMGRVNAYAGYCLIRQRDRKSAIGFYIGGCLIGLELRISFSDGDRSI